MKNPNHESPYVSIIIPAYNCERTISITIESILAQTFKNYEIVIVNDGSKDKTAEVVMSFQELHTHITLINSENMGPGHARNLGIERSGGEYLYFIDSDDQIHPHTLERYISLMNENNADLVVSAYQMNVIDKEKIVSSKKVSWRKVFFSSHDMFMEQLYELMNEQLMYVIWNKFYHAKIIKDNNIKFPPYKSCEDRLFNLHYYQYVNRCQITDEVLYDYSFESSQSLTNKYLPNKFETFEEFYLVLLELTHHNISGSSALFLKGAMSCIIPFHSKSCPMKRKEKMSNIKTIIQNKNIQAASQKTLTDTSLRKVFKWLFKIKSASLLFVVTYFMHEISNISPVLIEKLKENF